MQKTSIIILFGLLIHICAQAQKIEIKNLESHIKYLAADELKGRGTGTAEERKAAEYIAQQFQKYQLKPLGKNPNNASLTSYFYEFTFKKKNNPHDTSTSGIPDTKGIDVIAYLDKQAPQTIVIGAHYDHLGLGEDQNILDPTAKGQIHNGADDNASGTAGLLELARYFAQAKHFQAYNIIFIAFSGEELGLIGSKKWTENPTYPLDKIYYMINMDMIGRLNDETKKLVIYGVGTSNQWVPLIDSICVHFPFQIKKDSSGIGPSDHTSFYLKNIPVLHFFTGQHSDYHKPTDDANKINYKGEVQILEFIIQLIEKTAQQKQSMQFQKTAAPKDNKATFKVTMGIMPDYTFDGKGLRVDGVLPNKPAEKAGIQKGDIIIQLGGYNISNIEDYMKALSKFEKGQSTKVTIKRGNDDIQIYVTF